MYQKWIQTGCVLLIVSGLIFGGIGVYQHTIKLKSEIADHKLNWRELQHLNESYAEQIGELMVQVKIREMDYAELKASMKQQQDIIIEGQLRKIRALRKALIVERDISEPGVDHSDQIFRAFPVDEKEKQLDNAASGNSVKEKAE